MPRANQKQINALRAEHDELYALDIAAGHPERSSTATGRAWFAWLRAIEGRRATTEDVAVWTRRGA